MVAFKDYVIMLKGYDFFCMTPEKFDKVICKVCGINCDVKRNVMDYTGFAAAMAKTKTLHDQFKCPNVDEKWHKKALNLILDIESCNSPSLKKIMQTDLKNIIGNKSCQI